MKILFCSSEVVPFAASGGLGDVAGSLPKALNVSGQDVRVILPLYGKIKEKYSERFTLVDGNNTPETVFDSVYKVIKEKINEQH